MSDFSTSWNLSRQRFVDEVKDMSDEQLRWKPFPSALSIGQMAIHLAGVEVSFSSQLLDENLSNEDLKLKLAATEGVVNSSLFPFGDHEITKDSVRAALDLSRKKIEPIITSPSPEILSKEIKSALGPIITGEGALARLAIHPAYHQGQAFLLKMDPDFPA